jgi:hypothetical protein
MRVNALDVIADSVNGDAEFSSDLFAAPASNEKIECVLLANRQPRALGLVEFGMLVQPRNFVEDQNCSFDLSFFKRNGCGLSIKSQSGEGVRSDPLGANNPGEFSNCGAEHVSSMTSVLRFTKFLPQRKKECCQIVRPATAFSLKEAFESFVTYVDGRGRCSIHSVSIKAEHPCICVDNSAKPPYQMAVVSCAAAVRGDFIQELDQDPESVAILRTSAGALAIHGERAEGASEPMLGR